MTAHPAKHDVALKLRHVRRDDYRFKHSSVLGKASLQKHALQFTAKRATFVMRRCRLVDVLLEVRKSPELSWPNSLSGLR